MGAPKISLWCTYFSSSQRHHKSEKLVAHHQPDLYLQHHTASQ